MDIHHLLEKLPVTQQRWFLFCIFLVRNFIKDDCQQKAGSLTYTTMLSIVPIVTVLLVMLSSIPALASAKLQIQHLIYSNLLPSSSFQVSQYINEFAEKSSNLTAIGVIILFFTTIMTLSTIEQAFNQIWRVDKRQGGLKNIAHYWMIITLGPLVLGTTFIISSTIQSLSFLNHKIAGYGIDWAFWVQLGSFLTMTFGFIAMYWFIPRCKVRLLYAVIAGVLVSVTFEILKQTFGFVMSNFTSYQSIYGAFAALPIFLLWIYLSWNLILLGVEISYSLTIFETKDVSPRHTLLSIMQMLYVVYYHHQHGETVSEEKLRQVLSRNDMPNWYQYISYLQDNNLITSTDDGNYTLKRPLTGYTFWDFYQHLPYPLPHNHDLLYNHRFEPWLQTWLQQLADTDILLKQKFSVPMSDIFDNTILIKQIQTTDNQPIQEQTASEKPTVPTPSPTKRQAVLSTIQIAQEKLKPIFHKIYKKIHDK